LGKINEDIMTEMITIIAVGVGLAGLILNGQKNIRGDIKGLEARLEKLDARIGVLERQQAKLEGLLEGLREAISGRAPTNR
jgi:chaperonin cofactor prefoldin